LQQLLSEDLTNRNVLEYGCGTGDWGLVMAAQGARVTLLDLSPVAIEVALRRARVSGAGSRVTGIARDASDLSCCPDSTFDLVFASFSLHHTLKHSHALAELYRIIKPGGKLILAETYGNNPFLNCARILRRIAFRERREQGEGIVIGDAEIAMLERLFCKVTVRPVNLLAMAKRLFRGHFAARPAMLCIRMLEKADAYALQRFPSLKRYCGEALVTAVK
jgi:ubiquinone/menaquinone biosynthesis C-methylase UbiE